MGVNGQFLTFKKLNSFLLFLLASGLWLNKNAKKWRFLTIFADQFALILNHELQKKSRRLSVEQFEVGNRFGLKICQTCSSVSCGGFVIRLVFKISEKDSKIHIFSRSNPHFPQLPDKLPPSRVRSRVTY